MDILAVAEKRSRLVRWRSLTLDLDRHSIRIGDAVLSISLAEFTLFRLLLARRDVPMTREAIMSVLYGPAHGRDPRQADWFVARLRRVLAPFGFGNAIGTIAGRGYAIVDDLQEIPQIVDVLPCLMVAAA